MYLMSIGSLWHLCCAFFIKYCIFRIFFRKLIPALAFCIGFILIIYFIGNFFHFMHYRYLLKRLIIIIIIIIVIIVIIIDFIPIAN